MAAPTGQFDTKRIQLWRCEECSVWHHTVEPYHEIRVAEPTPKATLIDGAVRFVYAERLMLVCLDCHNHLLNSMGFRDET